MRRNTSRKHNASACIILSLIRTQIKKVGVNLKRLNRFIIIKRNSQIRSQNPMKSLNVKELRTVFSCIRMERRWFLFFQKESTFCIAFLGWVFFIECSWIEESLSWNTACIRISRTTHRRNLRNLNYPNWILELCAIRVKSFRNRRNSSKRINKSFYNSSKLCKVNR